MSKVIDEIKALAGPIAQKHGCELWDVEYVKEAGSWYLRVYIDRPEGVSINHCEAVNHELDPLLDERENLFPGSYTFEVSSAGAERRLRGPSDYERFSGRPVKLKLYKSRNGEKEFIGNLAQWDDDSVALDISGESHSFSKAEVAGVWLRLTFD